MENHWYKTFFEGVSLDCWRKCVTPDQTKAEVDFLSAELGCASGARVLDVPCGDGRHTLELAALGFQMTGVDISESQIQEAGLRAGPAALSIEWLCADMRDLDWAGEFDAAFAYDGLQFFRKGGLCCGQIHSCTTRCVKSLMVRVW